jgi:hypothetical protein
VSPPVGYALVLCGASRCVTELHDHALSAMRRVVRSSRLGVLVVARCPVGRLACGMCPPGPIVVVQPSDARQRPTAPAVRVGPLLTVEDVEIAEAWLREARFDPELLPERLVSLHRMMRAYVRN